jgi:alpha-beta hydrolase superfamily lysophospholipase
MRPAHVIEIATPKKFLLNGLWFGPTKPKTTIIWIHGLASSAFSKLGIVEKLVNANTAVMTFNNRGAATVTRVRKLNPKKKGGMEYVLAGGAHEVFTESIDDIQGAVDFARKQGAKKIFLAGHSTGSQKSAYFASKKGSVIDGIILLAPMSDYASAVHADAAGVKKGVTAARKLVAAGKESEIVPGSWTDAQRYLSLNTEESIEEIFSYAFPKKAPKTYRAVKVPLLVLLPEEDEYRDRPMAEIAAWFEAEQRSKRFALRIFKGTDHSFSGEESAVAKAITEWISA